MQSRILHSGGVPVIHNSFRNWVEAEVLPLQAAHPRWLRLDGETSGGNRSAVGSFRYLDRVWVVHADTWFDPVLIAYRAIVNDTALDPFVVKPAEVRDCLDLLPALKVPGEPKHFYVYGREE